VFENIWRRGLVEYDELEGIAWLWQAADGSNIEAPLAQESIGPNPTDRGKNGTKRSLLVDERGVPLSFVVTGANRHDSISLEPLLKGRILKPENEATPQNLCLDAAYVGKEDVVERNGFIPHIRPRGEENKLIEKDPTFKARRWVVELAHSWFNRFRKLLPRYEKTDLSYNALNALAAAMIVLNKVMVIYR
jgi:putative transposase